MVEIQHRKSVFERKEVKMKGYVIMEEVNDTSTIALASFVTLFLNQNDNPK